MKFSPLTDFGLKFVKIVVLSEINITMTTINEKSLKSIKLRVRQLESLRQELKVWCLANNPREK